jgi:hypothetical protein
MHGTVPSRVLQLSLQLSCTSAAGVPEQLYKLLSDAHTLLHVLHLAAIQQQTIGKELGLDQASSPVAHRMVEIVATFGYVQLETAHSL